MGIDQPYLKKTKFASTTKTGAIIEANVDMGHMAKMDKRCTAQFGRGTWSAKSHGFQSLTFNPGDGAEFVIWDSSRVISTRRHLRLLPLAFCPSPRDAACA